MKNAGLKTAICMALCCLPAAIVIMALTIGVGSMQVSAEPLGRTVIALALLACPAHAAWMFWRMRRQNGTRRTISCCNAPTQSQRGASDFQGIHGGVQRPQLEELGEV